MFFFNQCFFVCCVVWNLYDESNYFHKNNEFSINNKLNKHTVLWCIESKIVWCLKCNQFQNILDYIFTKLKCPTQFLNYVAVIHDNITNRKLYDISSEMIYCIIYTDIQQVRNWGQCYDIVRSILKYYVVSNISRCFDSTVALISPQVSL